jgi:hypothetical protein
VLKKNLHEKKRTTSGACNSKRKKKPMQKRLNQIIINTNSAGEARMLFSKMEVEFSIYDNKTAWINLSKEENNINPKKILATT